MKGPRKQPIAVGIYVIGFVYEVCDRTIWKHETSLCGDKIRRRAGDRIGCCATLLYVIPFIPVIGIKEADCLGAKPAASAATDQNPVAQRSSVQKHAKRLSKAAALR